MADSSKVRLVRCPKCENLLPELVDYSVYQCGGCGTVLRAKNKHKEEDTSSEKSDEERVGLVSAKSGSSIEKSINSSDASDLDIKSNAGSLSCDPMVFEKDDVKNAKTGENKSNNLQTMNNDNIDLSNSTKKEFGDLNFQIGPSSDSRGSGQKLDWKAGERGEIEGRLGNDSKGMKFSTSKYPQEGPSNNLPDRFSGYGKLLRDHDPENGANKVKYFEEDDRAELLRKLDELRDQLSRSCDITDMVDKTKENVPLDGKMYPPNTWSPDRSTRAQMQFFGPDKHGAGPSYSNFCPESFPYPNGNEMGFPGYYSSVHNPNQFPRFDEPVVGSQMLRTAPYQFPRSHPNHSRQYFESNPDPSVRYPQNAIFHQPSCSCFHCHDKYHQVSAPGSASYCNRSFPDGRNNPMSYHHENAAPCGPHVNNTRTDNPPLNFHVRKKSQSRWPSESKIGGFVHNHNRTTVLANSGRRFHPIYGGAPFVTCYNCFELLQLPKKLRHMVKNQQKIHCGACSVVINIDFTDKKLVLSDNAERERMHMKVDDTSADFSSDDYDNSGYDFQSIDREPILQSIDPGLSSINQHEMHSFHSSSSTIWEDENSPEVLTAPKLPNNSHQPIKSTFSPPAGSPLQLYFDHSTNNHVTSKGNRSGRSDQEKGKLSTVTSRQNSLKEASLATEMDVSFNEYSNTGVSQVSEDASREDATQPRESFLVNMIKKSFGSNKTDERVRGTVSVNGHVLPDRVIKKAEKLAGPIHPGKYWYDFRAGFWGAMGGPCLGIIPPFIEEFSYPMPENCAGGNTGVFVNGRELHQKDLDLLASRGLPISGDKSYIIEICGRVVDEDTGEELDSLGKLAPTVEKVKHGFGMTVPRGGAS